MSFQGKKNLYICDHCGHGFVTQDADEGVTPFLTTCLNCDQLAQSTCYKIPQQWLGTPAVRWIRPPRSEWDKLPLHSRDHLEKGGLLRDDRIRPRQLQS